MAIDPLWTSTLAEGFEVKLFASGRRERGKGNLLNEHASNLRFVITQTEVVAAGLPFSLLGMQADWPRNGLRIN